MKKISKREEEKITVVDDDDDDVIEENNRNYTNKHKLNNMFEGYFLYSSWQLKS